MYFYFQITFSNPLEKMFAHISPIQYSVILYIPILQGKEQKVFDGIGIYKIVTTPGHFVQLL